MTRSEATKSTAAEQLVDIRDVKIDRSLPSEERIKSFIEQIKNPYQFKVGNTVVRVSFANTQNTITDNFINNKGPVRNDWLTSLNKMSIFVLK